MFVRAITLILITVAAVSAQEQATTPDWPKCTSYALDNERAFTAKHRVCYFVQNELFSMASIGGALVGATYSQWTQSASDLTKGTPGFAMRFATSYGQSGAKAAGQYLSRFILGEDPRRRPPYVEPRPPQPFIKRLGYAIGDNFVAYKCPNPCEPDPKDNKYHYHRTFALSRVVGAFAGAYSSMLWSPDRLNTAGRSLRRVASTYGGTFGGRFETEFKPELSIGVGKLIGWISGAR